MPRPDEGVSRRRLIAGAGAGALELTALGSRAAAADPGGATAASVGRPVHHRLVPGTVHGVYSGGSAAAAISSPPS